jgi:hypothetical protein
MVAPPSAARDEISPFIAPPVATASALERYGAAIFPSVPVAQSYHYVIDCDMSCAADTKGGGRTSTVVARTTVTLYASIAAEEDERWQLVVAMERLTNCLALSASGAMNARGVAASHIVVGAVYSRRNCKRFA